MRTEQKPLKSGFGAKTTCADRPFQSRREPRRQLKTPEQGAATSVWCATSPQLEGKGGVYCMDADIAEVISDFTPQKLGPTTDWSAPLGYRSRPGGATVASQREDDRRDSSAADLAHPQAGLAE